MNFESEGFDDELKYIDQKSKTDEALIHRSGNDQLQELELKKS